MDKMFIIYEDYLPDGWTVERLEKAVKNKAATAFTKESIEEVVDMDKLNEELREIDRGILKGFSHYLKEKGEPTNTARSYVNMIKRLCEKYDTFACSLALGWSLPYTLTDLTGMYSPDGIKYEENVKKHNVPFNALNAFNEFVNLIKEKSKEF